MAQIIGIDIGTTSVCGVAIDTETGKAVRILTKDSHAFLSSAHSYERMQSTETVIALAEEILHALLSDETAAIGVTGQMHGIVYTDADGRAVSPLYTWQDRRGDQPYKDGKTYAGHLASYAGYGNVTDFYNRENGICPRTAVGYCTVQDYFVMRLCGLHQPLVHTTNAASLGCYDLKEQRFYYDCDLRVVDGYAVAGDYKGIPVGVAIGDNQAGVLATAGEDDVLLNVGTGSQISVIGDRIVTGEGIETRPFFEGKYLAVGAALCGGRAYAMLKDFYRQIYAYHTPLPDEAVYAIMGEMAQKAALPLKVDTRFSGTRGNTGIRGSICGISTNNFTPEALTAGVLDGMVEELVTMYRAMGMPKSGLVGSGNGIRQNRFLVSAAERALHMPMKIPAGREEAATGAAMYAGLATRIYKTMKHAAEAVVRYQ
jgi:sedoheptulokinase